MKDETKLLLMAGLVWFFVARKQTPTVPPSSFAASNGRPLSLLEVQFINLQRASIGQPELALSSPWEIFPDGSVRVAGDFQY